LIKCISYSLWKSVSELDNVSVLMICEHNGNSKRACSHPYIVFIPAHHGCKNPLLSPELRQVISSLCRRGYSRDSKSFLRKLSYTIGLFIQIKNVVNTKAQNRSSKCYFNITIIFLAFLYLVGCFNYILKAFSENFPSI
jgi:hypothetical protein